MKINISNYLFLIILLALGCSVPKKSMLESDQNINSKVELNNKESLGTSTVLLLNVRPESAEAKNYKALINDQFTELENLDSQTIRIHFERKNGIHYDCEIDILFNELSISNEESINNKQFSKVIQGQQVQSDDGPTEYTETVRGYVHQRKKKRKLAWDIEILANSSSNSCKISDSSFTESLTSKTVANTLSGDERAISKKYKDPLEQDLRSSKAMATEVIANVYKKIEIQLRRAYKNPQH